MYIDTLMRYCTFLIILLLSATGLHAQELLNNTSPRWITRFSFRQFNGGVMVLKAHFPHVKDSLNFILDTGSGGVSLDSTTCAIYKIKTTATDTTITGIGGVRKVHFVFNQSLSLPGITIPGLNFHVNDYEVLSSVYGERIDGILGYSFLSKYVVEVNYDSLFLDVYTPGKLTYPSGGYLLNPVFTSLPIIPLEIKDRTRMRKNFYFDTGAGLCFLLSERYANDSAVLLSRRKLYTTHAEGMAGRLQMKLTVMKEVKLGPWRFRAVPTYVYTDEYNVTAYPFSGGLIGNEILRRFNVTLNYGQREIFLKPNTHFADPFDYSYTGMGIYSINGSVMVEDVIQGSPADKAGLVVGDEIFGVEKNLSHNIQAYKNLIEIPNQRIKLFIRRDGKLFETFIKTISIL